MSDEIRPTPEGGCSYDECPSYDGKRCRLTGFRPYGCEPAWDRLRSRVATLERRLARVLELAAATGQIARRGKRGWWVEARRAHGRVWSRRHRSARSRLEELGGAPPSRTAQDATLAENLDALERER